MYGMRTFAVVITISMMRFDDRYFGGAQVAAVRRNIRNLAINSKNAANPIANPCSKVIFDDNLSLFLAGIYWTLYIPDFSKDLALASAVCLLIAWLFTT